MNLISIVGSVADVGWGHMGNWGAGGWLAMFAFWGLLIAGLVLLMRKPADTRGDAAGSPSQVLERRLADGDIGVDEYQERKAALQD